MTWTKLGDEFGDAAAELSDAAYRTHSDALLWSNRMLLDLIVPKAHFRRFAFSRSVDLRDPDRCAVVAELIEAGWWADRGENWDVGLRWPEWQRDRQTVERQRARDSARQRRHRAHMRDDHTLCEGPCSSPPVPSRVAPATHGVSHGVTPTVGHAVTGSGMCRLHAGQRAAHCSGCAADAKAAS